MRSSVRAIVLSAAASAVALPAAMAQTESQSLRQVAHTGHDSGQGGAFVDFGVPVINDAGLVAFQGGYRSGGFVLNYGLFTDTADGPGLPSLVARSGQPAPGTATNFGINFNYPYLNDAGQLAAQVFLVAEGRERSAIYAGSPDALSLLAREGHPAPAGPAGTIWYPLLNDSPFPRFSQATNDPGLRLNRAGQVAFGGWIEPGGAGGTLNGGLFIGSPDPGGGPVGSVQKVFVGGDTVPGSGGTLTLGSIGFVETQLGNPHPYVLNDQGRAFFRAQVRNQQTGPTECGFFTGSAGGADLAPVAIPGQPAPIGGGVVFGSAQQFGLGINNAGQVAFDTALQGPGIVTDLNDSAVFAGAPDDLRLVYQENDPIPGADDGARFAFSSGGLTMNALGQVAFVSATRGGSNPFPNDSVVVLGTPDEAGNDYDLTLAARVGDDAGLEGDVFRFTEFFGPTLNSESLLVFSGLVSGDATGDFRTGLWGFTETSGTFPILATGQQVEVSPGVFAPIDGLSFADGSGGQDGRRIGLTDDGELAVLLRFPGTGGAIYDYGIYAIDVHAPAVPELSVWAVDADGIWSAPTNWTGPVPNRTDAVAVLGSVITRPRQVIVDAPVTLGALLFDGDNRYTVAGPSTLTMHVSPGNAALLSALGPANHLISAPLTLASDTTVNVAQPAATLTLSNLAPTAARIQKTGPGTVAVNRVRAAALDIAAGTVRVVPDGGDEGVSILGELTLAGTTDAWTSTLDLADNDLILRADAATRDQLLAQAVNQVKHARNTGTDGNWTGAGITSSAAAETPLTGLAAMLNPGLDTFGGQPVDADDILIKYTYNGDANLDGVINADDYFRIDSGFLAQPADPTYAQGDFNYDGTINADDYFLIDSAFLGQGAPLGITNAVAAVSVPEPGAVSVLLPVAGAGLRRRHRSSTLPQGDGTSPSNAGRRIAPCSGSSPP